MKDRRRTDNLPIHIRIGINSGAAVGAVVGTSRFHWDLWGTPSTLPRVWSPPVNRAAFTSLKERGSDFGEAIGSSHEAKST